MITGSGGLQLAGSLKLPFEQEVVTCSIAVKHLIPETDCVIELGGEDAKITFFGATVEQRMNGTCAGGTGAFIDQMAILLNTDGDGLNEAAKDFDTIYPIAKYQSVRSQSTGASDRFESSVRRGGSIGDKQWTGGKSPFYT